jgi:peptide/nickel transport system substrate-binding protein
VGLTGKRRATRAFGLMFVLVLALSACSSSSKSSSGSGGSNTATTTPGKPKEGGSITIATEAETTGGWCLPEAQLAAAGIQVARAIYDTLTVPDAHNNYVPFLAQTIDHNSNYTVWTINLRSGIVFQDGTPFNAQAVVDNLNAYTGKTDSKNLLFKFEFDAEHWISNIKATGPLTVEVDLKNPWVAFPAHLYSYGRLGMEAEAQLHAGANCYKDMIGTGPFKLKEWVPNDHLTVVKNPNYWRKDQYGQQLPYLDQITFKPVVDPNTLANGLKSKLYTMSLTDSPDTIALLQSSQKSGQINFLQDTQFPETTYNLFNATKAPFDDMNARRAFEFAVDSVKYNQVANHNLQTKTAGPFGPGTIAYVDPSKYPAGTVPPPNGDVAQAKKYVAAYEQDTGQTSLQFTYLTGQDSFSLRDAQVLQGFMQAAGMQMQIKQEEQSAMINDVIAGNYQVTAWRNHPGFDPDTQWIWWHCYAAPAAVQPNQKNIATPGPPTNGNNCDNPVNFSHFNDSVINKDLETGRENPNPQARANAYQNLNIEFAKQGWEAWGYYSIWTIPSQTNLQGILGPNLPTSSSANATGAAPFPGLSSGNDVSGLWIS